MTLLKGNRNAVVRLESGQAHLSAKSTAKNSNIPAVYPKTFLH